MAIFRRNSKKSINYRKVEFEEMPGDAAFYGLK
jgi:hypothetical protein